MCSVILDTDVDREKISIKMNRDLKQKHDAVFIYVIEDKNKINEEKNFLQEKTKKQTKTKTDKCFSLKSRTF